jgi:hypothetical protein
MNVRRVVVVTAVSVLSIYGAPNAGAAPIVDQSFTSPFDLGAAINECCRFVAQTFTAGLTGTLAGISIDVETGTSSFPLHVGIRTAPGGVPSSTVLGEVSLTENDAPLSRLITFPQTIEVFEGVQYAIAVNYEGAPPPGAFQGLGQWAGATGDAYPRGSLFSSVSDGISWSSPGTGFDVHFRTYVEIEVVTKVGIDIKPQGFPNSIRLSSSGKVPVAILTTSGFDATEVDVSTVCFGDAENIAQRDCTQASGSGHVEDADRDGDLDLVLRFDVEQTGIDMGDTQACLTGMTFSGEAIEGCDSVRTQT